MKTIELAGVMVVLEQWRVVRAHGRKSRTPTWGVTVEATGEVLAEGHTSQATALETAKDVIETTGVRA